MTHITVEIPKEQDLDTLLALFRQMNLRITISKTVEKGAKDSKASIKAIKKQLLNKPLMEKFDKEAIKKAQNWSGEHKKTEMLALIQEMDIQEPIENLLAQLSK